MSKYTVAELKQICRKKGIRKYSNLKKKELIKLCLGGSPNQDARTPRRGRSKRKRQGVRSSARRAGKATPKGARKKKRSRKRRNVVVNVGGGRRVNVEFRDCSVLNDTTLRKHQEKVVKFYMKSKLKGLVAFHSVGSGKTITSIATANCLLQINPSWKAVILTPVSVASQFNREIKRLIPHRDVIKKIKVISHTKWLNDYSKGKVTAKDTFLIVDEAHKFKTPNSKKAKVLLDVSKKAKKIMLLTATPVENRPNEIGNYMAMIKGTTFLQEQKELENKLGDVQVKIKINNKAPSGKKPPKKKNMLLRGILGMLTKNKSYQEELLEDIEQESIVFNNQHQINQYLKCKFSYFKPKDDYVNFPEMTQRIVQISMSKEFRESYEKIEQKNIDKEIQKLFTSNEEKDLNLSTFLNGLRRAVNKLNFKSPKIDWVLNHVLDRLEQNQKVIIYSNWVEFGIREIINEFDEYNRGHPDAISYGFISGSVSKKNRQILLDEYNNNELMVLLFTVAGAEGLDLKETRSVVILEPYWHPSRIDQVIGRAVRYKSHDGLPPKDRFVDVYHLLLVKGKKHKKVDNVLKAWWKKRKSNSNSNSNKAPGTVSVDVILYNLTNDKRKAINTFYKYIIENSIEKQQC